MDRIKIYSETGSETMDAMPLGDHVILRTDPKGEMDNYPTRGTVLAVGPGTEDVTMELDPGDRVVFDRYDPFVLTEHGKDVIVIRQCNIKARLGG